MFDDSPFIQVMVMSDSNYLDDVDEGVLSINGRCGGGQYREPLSNFDRL